MTSQASVSLQTPPSGAQPPASQGDDKSQQADVLKDKFGGDVGKLAKSYSEAESELGRLRTQITELQKGGQQQTDKPADKPADQNNQQQQQTDKKPSTPEEMDKAAQETAKAAGLDYEALTAKFTKTGKIDDADYAAFAKIGITRAIVDQFIDNAKAVGKSSGDALLAEVGISNFDVMTEWATKGGLSKNDINAYNAAVDSGDPSRMKQALSLLKQAYETKNGQHPNLREGNDGPTTAAFYRDRAEWMKDVNNPDYAKSPAFRETVRQKLANSPNI